jgi:hypothetical protein
MHLNRHKTGSHSVMVLIINKLGLEVLAGIHAVESPHSVFRAVS